jgi:hypothetical protein
MRAARHRCVGRPAGELRLQIETIADVLARLDEIIEAAQREESRAGYFAALYRRVTAGVARGIEEGAFDDGARMQDFDVRFALRYLDAFDAYAGNRPLTESWRVCFDAASDRRPIVLQHLGLAMNSHINLDLGIAAARTAPGAALPSLRGDFDRINDLLESMVDEVEADLARIWPLLRPLDWLAGRKEERIAGFSIGVARQHAWRFAEQLATQDALAQAASIARVDEWIALFGRNLHRPPFVARFAQRLIRFGERGSVSEIIQTLR